MSTVHFFFLNNLKMEKRENWRGNLFHDVQRYCKWIKTKMHDSSMDEACNCCERIKALLDVLL